MSCRFCLKPLPSGAGACCSPECDDGWWRICPTIDGAVYAPEAEDEESEEYQRPAGRKPQRLTLKRPPDPEDGAGWRDAAYISGDRLRRQLLETNP